MERIGIYGGTFNPPHIGHLEAAKQAVSRLNLDRLLMVPANVAPHKVLPPNSPTALQRMEMLRIAAADCPQIEISDVELCREGVSYTWQTIQALRESNPHAELILIMGTDMFLSFRHWKNPEKILEDASLAVFYRGNWGEHAAIDAEKAYWEEKGVRVQLVENDIINISSTQMRRLLIFRCAADFLPAGICVPAPGFCGTRERLSLKATPRNAAPTS